MVRRTPKPPADGEQTEKVKADDLREGSNGFANAHLLSFVERFERLTEEISVLSDDRKEVMAEAKSMGFDTKTMRKAIYRRAMDPAARAEGDAMLDLYEAALQKAEKNQVAQSIKDGT
jgi:uncharacterized protein (UPF0335 family)